jgi:hypothetical protein
MIQIIIDSFMIDLSNSISSKFVYSNTSLVLRKLRLTFFKFSNNCCKWLLWAFGGVHVTIYYILYFNWKLKEMSIQILFGYFIAVYIYIQKILLIFIYIYNIKFIRQKHIIESNYIHIEHKIL